MLLNTHIWSQTVAAAKQVVSNNPAWTRAIERADLEIRKSRYWSFDGLTLTIQSATSNKFYRVDDNHICDACASGYKARKRRAARRLMIRYTERLQASPVLTAKSADERIDRFTTYTSAPIVKRSGNAVIV